MITTFTVPRGERCDGSGVNLAASTALGTVEMRSGARPRE